MTTKEQKAAALAAKDAEVTTLCRSAFLAEHQRNYHSACDLHSQSIVALQKLVDDTGFLDRERKRIGRKQIKFHNFRLELLRPIKDGRGQKDKDGNPILPIILPTGTSAQEEMQRDLIEGKVNISFDELSVSRYLEPLGKAVAEGVTGQLATNQVALTSHIESKLSQLPAPPASIAHLFVDQVPFYTPTLPTGLPPITYHIYYNSENIILSGTYYYFKVKDYTDKQTLYVLSALKRRRYQIPNTTFHRASEFTSPCIVTVITPTYSSSTSGIIAGQEGRQLTHYTSSSLPITEPPDRTKHRKWSERRFTYGRRRFVWRPVKNKLTEELVEVKKEWKNPNSKTGKMMEEVFEEKIFWSEQRTALKKAAVFHFHGGVDQMFREFILASQLTRWAVQCFGHDR